jgi:hypothetical protein
MLAKGADPDAICGSGNYMSLSTLSIAVRLKLQRLIRELVLRGAALRGKGATFIKINLKFHFLAIFFLFFCYS